MLKKYAQRRQAAINAQIAPLVGSQRRLTRQQEDALVRLDRDYRFWGRFT